MIKKLLSMALSLVMCMSLCVPAFASETSTTVIIRDDNELRVAQTIFEESRFVATYDKVSNVMTLEQFSLVTGEKTLSTVSDFDEEVEIRDIPLTFAASDSRSTISGYSYSVRYGSPSSWTLARPRYKDNPSSGTYSFMCTEMPSYAGYLNGFRESVNTLSTVEKQLADLTSNKDTFNCITLALASTTNPVALGAALSTLLAGKGYGDSAQSKAYEVGDAQSNCLYYYENANNEWFKYL